MTQQEKETKLFEIFSNVTDKDIKFKYDEVLHKILVALDTMFTPNLGLNCSQTTNATGSNLYKKCRGELYKDVIEISLNHSTITILSNIPHRTSIPMGVLFPALIDFRALIKNEMAYIRLNRFRYSIYKDLFEKLNEVQFNVKKFTNYFWGNIEKSILIESDVNLKEYVYDTMSDLHSHLNLLYGNDILAIDYDTFYLKKGSRGLVEVSDVFANLGFKFEVNERKTFGVTPSGDFVKFDYYVDSFECNGMTLRVK